MDTPGVSKSYARLTLWGDEQQVHVTFTSSGNASARPETNCTGWVGEMPCRYIAMGTVSDSVLTPTIIAIMLRLPASGLHSGSKRWCEAASAKQAPRTKPLPFVLDPRMTTFPRFKLLSQKIRSIKLSAEMKTPCDREILPGRKDNGCAGVMD